MNKKKSVYNKRIGQRDNSQKLNKQNKTTKMKLGKKKKAHDEWKEKTHNQ